MPLIPELFTLFLTTVPEPLPPDIPEGIDPVVFARRLGLSEDELRACGLVGIDIPIGKLTRDALRIRCDKAVSKDEIIGALLSIFAWGGMSHGHPSRIWHSPSTMSNLVGIINELRRLGKHISPLDGFRLFAEARSHGLLPFLGLSFYTKILFFFFPDHLGNEAPILDRFVARSIDTLFDNCPIPLWGGVPAESDQPAIVTMMYDRYLSCLDELRNQMQIRTERIWSRSQIEWLLFRPGPWRDSVSEMY